jgi:hypothetical protein
MKPNPGSEQALKQGCTCPVLENAHGRGIRWPPRFVRPYPEFWIDEDCPLHRDWKEEARG